jgi:hypothetical protein
MSDQHSRQPWEAQLQATASAFAYPITPDIAGAVAAPRSPARGPGRLWSWALLVLLLIGRFLAVPQVRARLIDGLRIGSVRISLVEPTPTAQQSASGPATPGDAPTSTLPPRLRQLRGETTLAEAKRSLPFPITLPTIPSTLGAPDRVFMPAPSGHVAVLVWLDPQATEAITLSLHILDSAAWAQKMAHRDDIEPSSVNGRPAIWLRGQHELYFYDPNSDFVYLEPQLVSGNVLIWTTDELTYRLETSGDLEAARRIAESIP